MNNLFVVSSFDSEVFVNPANVITIYTGMGGNPKILTTDGEAFTSLDCLSDVVDRYQAAIGSTLGHREIVAQAERFTKK